jgi:predicted transcriptional regulator
MKVLLSIKPEFANKIFSGSKKFEFRKSIFRNKNISKIVVYASAPVQRVIGEFEIEDILASDPNSLWEKTHTQAGISKSFFDSYFKSRDIGYAIKIRDTVKYENPLLLSENFNIRYAPQSFLYLDE